MKRWLFWQCKDVLFSEAFSEGNKIRCQLPRRHKGKAHLARYHGRLVVWSNKIARVWE